MNLREMRFSKRINQWDICVETGIPQSRLSLIERGYIEPNEEEKKRIAGALNCNIKDIFSDKQKDQKRIDNENKR